MKFFEIVLEIFGWLQIVIGTTLGFGGIGFLGYCLFHTVTVFLIVSSIGFILGVIWATHIWKKYGTIEWLSRIRRIS